MATVGQIDAVVRSYAGQSAAVRERVMQYVRRQWARLSSYRDDDIDVFVAAIIPAVAAGLIQTATVTDGYLAAVEAVVTGSPVRPVGVARSVVSMPALRGVDARTVYARVGPTVWTELSKGADIQTAAARGLDRIERVVQTDLQLARTHTSRLVLSTKLNVVGYRRVLSGSENCNLCRVASTQRYRTDELMPIHNRCDCGIRAIYGKRDPGRVIDRNLLDTIKAEQAAGKAPVAATVQHAEIGPQLVDSGHHARTKADLPRAAKTKAKRSEQLRERWDANLEAAQKNGGLVEVDPKTLRPIVRD